MKITLAILALVVFAVSLVADYKWRQWMQRRRADQQAGSDSKHGPRS